MTGSNDDEAEPHADDAAATAAFALATPVTRNSRRKREAPKMSAWQESLAGASKRVLTAVHTGHVETVQLSSLVPAWTLRMQDDELVTTFQAAMLSGKWNLSV